MFCRNCGQELPDSARFCKFCGNPVPQPAQRDEELPAETEKKTEKTGRGWKKAVLSAAVLIALAAGGILFFLWKSGNIELPEQLKSEDAKIRDAEEMEKTESEDTEQTDREKENAVSSDLDTEIESIRKQYNRIVEKRMNGDYDHQEIRDGIEAYWDGEKLALVEIKAGTGGISYSRSYYYDGKDVIYSYYENEDAYRLYFRDGKLIRLRYAEDASRPVESVNYDQEASDQYESWEENTLEEGRSFLTETQNN